MSKYARQIATAQRIIAKKGQVVTWKKRVSAIPDGTKPWKESAVAADPNQEYSVSMVFLRPGNSLSKALVALIKGTDVPTGAPRALMGAVNFTPEVNDSIVRDGVSLVIRNFNVVAPNGEPILYDIEFA